jgi:zinc/manganese transport system substrate-binding protein
MSDGIALKEVPAVVDRSQGDLHAFGNTHVWADPYAVRTMAERVRDALVRLRPEEAEAITARHTAFHTELTKALIKWLTEYRSLKGERVVVYHRSWIYFLDRFGLMQDGTIEPKPRVAPTASHIAELEKQMKASDVRLILREPYQHPEAADHVAAATGAEVLVLSTHPGFPEGVDGIIEHFDYNLRALAEALKTEDEDA